MASDFEVLLQHLRALTGIPYDTGKAPEDREFIHAADYTERDVVALTESYGLRCRHLTRTLAEAINLAGSMTPLVTRLNGNPVANWLVLEGRKGRAVKLTLIGDSTLSMQRFSLRQIRKHIGIDAATPIEWLAVCALAPLQVAVSPSGQCLPPVQRLLKVLQPERQEIALSVVFALGVGILSLATPVAVQGLVNTFALGGLLQPLIVLSVLLFAFLSASGALRILQTYVVEIIQRRLFVRVLADLAYRLPRLRSEVLDRAHGTHLVNRFFDVLTLQKVSAILLLDGVAIVFQTTIGLLVLALYHPLLLAFDFLLIVAILIIVFVLGKNAETTAIAESKCKYAAVDWLEELVRNPLAFKQHGSIALAERRADSRALDYLYARKRHFNIILRQTIGSVALQAIAGTALLAVGGDLVIRGQLTLGQLVAAELIVSSVLASFSKFGKQLENFYDLLAAVEKLGHVLDLPLEQMTGTREPLADRPATLHLQGVCFGHPDRPDIISDYTLSLTAGERVGLVGGHGVGKSSLAELLVGLRDVREGCIRINGIDVRDLYLDILRRYVVVVKEPEILEDTIVENIRMGRSELSLYDIRQAVAGLGLLEDVLSLPEGMNTKLNHAGKPLSVGQTRRLMLARAAVGRPAVMVIDGLLDDLEPSAQTQACDYLFAPTAPWTLLIISVHDQGYIQRCDRVLRYP
jgi:putative ABC transport system ATP-binding protein